MDDSSGADDRGTTSPVWYLVLFLSTAGVALAITMLFLGTRSVMEIGGSCASGGPYVSARPCPKGIGWAVPGAIWGGLISAAVSVAAASRVGAPVIAWLAWPGLFLSLGWNFLEFGFDPPGPQGIVWGWIVGGVLFLLMGGGPLLGAVSVAKGTLGDGPSTSGGSGGAGRAGARTRAAAAKVARAGAKVRATTTPPAFRMADPAATSLVDELERLAGLHRSGALSAEEFAAAKRAVISGSST